MKIKINKKGYLFIERAGVMKGQWCPYDTEPRGCGDWCPLFGEPISEKQDSIFPYSIYLCKKKLYFDKLTNERKA